jgi:hypothetical protein
MSTTGNLPLRPYKYSDMTINKIEAAKTVASQKSAFPTFMLMSQCYSLSKSEPIDDCSTYDLKVLAYNKPPAKRKVPMSITEQVAVQF